jgi:hypothetical protein
MDEKNSKKTTTVKKPDEMMKNKTSEKKPLSLLNLFLTGLGAAAGVLLGKFLGVGTFSLLLVVLIGYVPGWYLGKWWANKPSGPKVVNIAIYSGAIAWILPLLGFFVGGLALAGAKTLKLPGNKHLIWIYGGLIASFINAVIGAYMWLNA